MKSKPVTDICAPNFSATAQHTEIEAAHENPHATGSEARCCPHRSPCWRDGRSEVNGGSPGKPQVCLLSLQGQGRQILLAYSRQNSKQDFDLQPERNLASHKAGLSLITAVFQVCSLRGQMGTTRRGRCLLSEPTQGCCLPSSSEGQRRESYYWL